MAKKKGGARIALVGDSSFDNRTWVKKDEPDVIRQLRDALTLDDEAELFAEDGSYINDVMGQITSPQFEKFGATHIFISIGGNDALWHKDLLNYRCYSSGTFLKNAYERLELFEFDYEQMLRALPLPENIPIVVCTIYNANYREPTVRQSANMALRFFNDVIIRKAVEYDLPIMDLRTMFNREDCYANDIEPSVVGGKRMVSKIIEIVENADFTARIH